MKYVLNIKNIGILILIGIITNSCSSSLNVEDFFNSEEQITATLSISNFVDHKPRDARFHTSSIEWKKINTWLIKTQNKWDNSIVSHYADISFRQKKFSIGINIESSLAILNCEINGKWIQYTQRLDAENRNMFLSLLGLSDE